MLYLRNIFLPKLCLGIFISLNESSEKENDMLFSWWKYFMYKRAGQMEKKNGYSHICREKNGGIRFLWMKNKKWNKANAEK